MSHTLSPSDISIVRELFGRLTDTLGNIRTATGRKTDKELQGLWDTADHLRSEIDRMLVCSAPDPDDTPTDEHGGLH